ncbi:MAG: sulfatase-like hydrolase/transferase [Verrucomicrobia bacterium]|nr:sulfatase-like hydrolase/transferase [Verrucomicrobiota bacterium]
MKRPCLLLGALAAFGTAASGAADRPNLLWITSEDHGPHLGAYGDKIAATPHLDALAARGLRYRRAWSCAPVCAPARTTIISGLFATSAGAEHMRSMVALPAGRRLFPEFLREAGYYCTNNSKEDYNLTQPARVWDVSSRQAHWRNRAAGQPFFAVFNSNATHEGQIRKSPHPLKVDPARVRVPAFHPDTPEVRRDWAQYHTNVSAADAVAGAHLADLATAGLADDTIVFYFADHGPGLPRHKRWPGNSGLQVPLIVYFPPKWRHLAPPDFAAGAESDRLVSFVDFAPTVLSLAGLPPPAWMQGRAFAGKFATEPAPYLHGFRGRMDERVDLVRSVTDGRYVYLRNYLPHLSPGQHVNAQFNAATTQLWRKLYDEGKLDEAQSLFWRAPKAPEELYDLQEDPDEVRNLAGSPAHREVLARLRAAQQAHARAIRDVGFLPEGEMQVRAAGASPHDLARDDARYPFERIFAAAELASGFMPEAVPGLRVALGDADRAVRYWGALGFLIRGRGAVEGAAADLRKALDDPSPFVRLAAAWALAEHGNGSDARRALAVLADHAPWDRNDVFVSMAALTAIDNLGAKAAPLREAVRSWPAEGPAPDDRYRPYVPQLLRSISTRLETTSARTAPRRTKKP